mmetsp:Transcript_1995/g.2680  ORF Transcript_1995/g.2680 Transcript_1995/m.2680 type:complete len:200 (-) Transcript_1995:472-1071(-)
MLPLLVQLPALTMSVSWPSTTVSLSSYTPITAPKSCCRGLKAWFVLMRPTLPSTASHCSALTCSTCPKKILKRTWLCVFLTSNAWPRSTVSWRWSSASLVVRKMASITVALTARSSTRSRMRSITCTRTFVPSAPCFRSLLPLGMFMACTSLVMSSFALRFSATPKVSSRKLRTHPKTSQPSLCFTAALAPKRTKSSWL